MENLLIILGLLFVALVVVVKLTERYGKPMEPQQQQKLSRWIIILVGVSLVAGLIRFFVTGSPT